MKTSRATAALWDRANKRTAARHGLPGSDPADALHPVVTIPQLIKSIGVNPAARELLAERDHELSPAQRRKALEAFDAAASAARNPRAKAAAPRPPLLRRHDLTFGRTGLRFHV